MLTTWAHSFCFELHQMMARNINHVCQEALDLLSLHMHEAPSLPHPMNEMSIFFKGKSRIASNGHLWTELTSSCHLVSKLRSDRSSAVPLCSPSSLKNDQIANGGQRELAAPSISCSANPTHLAMGETIDVSVNAWPCIVCNIIMMKTAFSLGLIHFLPNVTVAFLQSCM